MRLRIGEVLRVSQAEGGGEGGGKFRSYQEVTRGRHVSCADVQKGIWAYRGFPEVGKAWDRIPALLLHSNPLKEGSEQNPWVDVVEPDAGFAIYNGDNRDADQDPTSTRGNALLLRAYEFYSTPALRAYAPPLLLFTQRAVKGNTKGFREFSGYGVPSRLMLVTQREKTGDRCFTNLVAEIALFRLEEENECLDWRWVDLRRSPEATVEETLSAAPAAWRLWVREGPSAISRCRRLARRGGVAAPAEQVPSNTRDVGLLRTLADYYAAKPHAFEGLAALIAERVIGHGCTRGWVTRRSGDGGVDFVCRLALGTEFSQVRLVVLGQAKCTASVSGHDLARLVARLQRGWLGVFVTTGTFTRNAQEELLEDAYPLVLVNGARVAREVRLLLNSEGISLQDLLSREESWFSANQQSVAPERILDEAVFGTRVESLTNRDSE